MSSTLKPFLAYLHNHYEQLSPAQHQLILQLYAKYTLLENKKPITSDDWDYISLGILLKTMTEQQQG